MTSGKRMRVRYRPRRGSRPSQSGRSLSIHLFHHEEEEDETPLLRTATSRRGTVTLQRVRTAPPSYFPPALILQSTRLSKGAPNHTRLWVGSRVTYLRSCLFHQAVNSSKEILLSSFSSKALRASRIFSCPYQKPTSSACTTLRTNPLGCGRCVASRSKLVAWVMFGQP